MTTISTARDTLRVINPATEEVVAELAVHGEDLCADAVGRAGGAQRTWAAMPGERRSEILWRWAQLVENDFAELGRLDTEDTGKVLADARAQARRGARHARYWAGKADKLFGQQFADVPGQLSYTRLEALGPYVVILPWNAPAHSFMARVSPPLACGNSVIVKPSELSPRSAVRLAELAVQAGFPEGVLQVMVGGGATGAALCAHPDVAGISFTGSVPTGRHIARSAADTFKKLTLEMGGKSPIIVFDDADLDSAARATVLGILNNAGQVCAAGSRLLVHASIAKEFVAEVAARMSRVRVGDPLDAHTQMGPVVSCGQYEKILGILDNARSEGARIVLGGGRPAAPQRGFYVAPTLIDRVDSSMAVASQEIFGPVLSVLTFETEEQALELANETEFGLTSYVWTRDLGRMIRMSEGIDAGVVHGNSNLVLDSVLPFGGFKQSGLGGAYGDDAVAGCTRTKRVTLRIADTPLPGPWPGI
ncbi:aldehyde dehydrogenase family protein [Prescottella defluvii]|uniref:aldehyde dehydrogenase family protein n=1 Tax=Prescottella defluvii TaxID=1323361 RepID=UPI0009E0AE2F|nr:aldehyde dehydrogenase family protein [Prescottella defluvii]